MKIRTKILLLIILGAIFPLAISHLIADRIWFSNVASDVTEQVLLDAQQVAGRIDDRVNWMLEGTSMVVNSLPFENFEQDDLPKALIIPYRQLTYSTVVVLLDGRGKAVIPPFVPTREEAETLGRDVISKEEMASFAKSVPMQGALDANFAVGPVYLSESGEPRVVVASTVTSGTDEKWVLAIGVSLSKICEVSKASSGVGRVGSLLDADGHTICGSSDGVLKKDSNFKVISSLKHNVVSDYKQGKSAYFAVNSPVSVTGWGFFYRRNKADIFADYNKLRQILAIWILVCLGIAVVGAFVLSSGITRPIGDLVDASVRVADGDYEKPMKVTSGDEFGQLSDSFNRMMAEIKTWNRELNNRVDDKTRELNTAQEQIIKTQKLVALGELGAGVAHEINNPLTGVVGNAQLLLSEMESDSENREIVQDIVKNARRVAEVVDHLLRFSQQQWGETMMPVVLEKVLVKSIDLYLERLKEKEVEITWRTRESAQILGIDRDIQIVCTSLLDNALRAVDVGGKFTLEVRRVDGGAILMAVEDDGCGMSEEMRTRAVDPFFTTAPTDSGSLGVGLTTVQRIVDEHEGTLDIWSREGVGTKIKIYFAGKVEVSKD